MSIPKISIIVPTFNADITLVACLESIINQTYGNKEILIIDGASTDNTIEVIKDYASKLPFIKWISEKDSGIYDAMNKGIRLATGEWIYFLGSDDVLMDKEVLQSIFSEEHDVCKYDVIYGNVLFKHSGVHYDGKFSSFKLLEKNICHQAIFVKRIVFEKIGYFDLKYRMLADWCFNMHWFNNRYIRHKFIDIMIATYDEAGSSFNIPDEQFCKDRPFIERSVFSSGILFLFKNRYRRGVRQFVHLLFNY